jgi:DNA-binding CsgD family transcriptional regulator
MFNAATKVFPIQPATSAREGWHGYRLPKESLSTRETEICKLLTTGMHLKEVAVQLAISLHTADSHTRNAYLKLGVHDRGELVRHFAQRSGDPAIDTLPDAWPKFTKN